MSVYDRRDDVNEAQLRGNNVKWMMNRMMVRDGNVFADWMHQCKLNVLLHCALEMMKETVTFNATQKSVEPLPSG